MYLYKIRLIFQAKSEGWHAPYLDYKLSRSYAENGLLMFSSQTSISKTKYYGTARQSEWVHKCHTCGMFALCFIYLAEFVAHKTDKIDTSSLQKMMKMNNLIFKSGNIWRKAVLQLQRVQRVQLLFSIPQALQPSTLLYTLITPPPSHRAHFPATPRKRFCKWHWSRWLQRKRQTLTRKIISN